MEQENSSLKNSTRKGLFWSTAGSIANQGMNFVFSIILARLLAPSDYGVIGMLAVFICIVSVFIDSGFSAALIAKQDRTQKDFSTEFYFNIVVGFVAYAILFAVSPLVSSFYEMPILSPILKVIGLGVLINSFCVVQSAQFAIRLDFKTPAIIGVVTNIFTGIVGIVLAFYGFGVWALVFQRIASATLNAVLLWILAGWRPTWEFSMDSFKYQWSYGSKILGSTLIQQVYDNLYPLVIGKFFSSQQLGLYSRAQGFAALPSTNFSNILGSVTFPVLSKINDDFPRLVSVYRRMMRTSAFVVFPMMVGLAVIAEPLIKVLLNEQWYECVPYLQLLCIALIWQPLSYIQINVLKVIGRTDVILKLEILKRSAGLISIFAAIPFGVIGMCVGFAIFYIYCFTLNLIFSCRALKVSYWSMVRDILPILFNAIVMGVIVLSMTTISLNKYVQLTLCTVTGIAYYYISTSIFMKSILKDAISMFINRK